MALFKQWDERMQRQVLIGVGKVLVDNDGDVKKYSKVKNTEKIKFSVMTGLTTVGDKEDTTFEVVPLAIYKHKGCENLYAIAETVQKNDQVFFMGWLYQTVYLDKSGKQRKFIELRVEWLQRAADLIVSYSKNTQESEKSKEWF